MNPTDQPEPSLRDQIIYLKCLYDDVTITVKLPDAQVDALMALFQADKESALRQHLTSKASFEILGLLYNRQIQPQEAVRRLQDLGRDDV